jgi:hypothetical protein
VPAAYHYDIRLSRHRPPFPAPADFFASRLR